MAALDRFYCSHSELTIEPNQGIIEAYCKFGNFCEVFSFVKMKSSRFHSITLSFTDIGKSCPSRDFLMSQICLIAIRENKILAKISEFTVCFILS